MTRLVLVSDEHIVEGLLGSITFLIIAFILTKFLKMDFYLVGALDFLLTFYFRKIVVNTYRYLKKRNIFSIKPWTMLF